MKSFKKPPKMLKSRKNNEKPSNILKKCPRTFKNHKNPQKKKQKNQKSMKDVLKPREISKSRHKQ